MIKTGGKEALTPNSDTPTNSSCLPYIKLSCISHVNSVLTTLSALCISSKMKDRGKKHFLGSPRSLSPSVMLSSGAELSHCEQRDKSLFTNQLSSAPALRGSPRARSVTHAVLRSRHPAGRPGEKPCCLFIFSSCVKTAPPVAIAAVRAAVVW